MSQWYVFTRPEGGITQSRATSPDWLIHLCPTKQRWAPPLLACSQLLILNYQNAGAGYDQIDVPACSKRKIYVSNTPGAVDDATADNAVFLIIGTLRNFNGPLLSLRKGQWRGPKPPPIGHDPQGRTLGILGMGGIGRNVARKMQVFGMKIIYYNRRRLEPAEEGGARYVSFEELLGQSDVLSLNLPLNVSKHFPSFTLLQDLHHS